MFFGYTEPFFLFLNLISMFLMFFLFFENITLTLKTKKNSWPRSFLVLFFSWRSPILAYESMNYESSDYQIQHRSELNFITYYTLLIVHQYIKLKRSCSV